MGKTSEATTHTITANGFDIHVEDLGSGPAILLLHGFPDFHRTWHRQRGPLAASGYRVITIDLPGYGQSSRSRRVEAMEVRNLCRTLDALLDGLGIDDVHLVGHDWGGLLAWFFTMLHPHRVKSLLVLNILHPERLFHGLRHGWRQRLRSWYMFAFLIPRVPERILARDRSVSFVHLFTREPRHPFPNDEIDRYRSTFNGPESFVGPINYYRSLIHGRGRVAREAIWPIGCPTKIVFGAHDPHLLLELVPPRPDLVPDCTIEILHNTGHWPHHDEPDHVTTAILDWAAGAGRPAEPGSADRVSPSGLG